ncbi:MAG: glycosyltransferase, partial [Thermosynechococcaceae cyanobacterium]
GQTATEALACGTPVVAFNATGLKDIVTHQQDGYLATPYEVDDLCQGLTWILEDPERYRRLCYQSRINAERAMPLSLQAERYQALYRDLTKL